MKVAVLGLWHLGSVTAACLAAAGHSVTAFDPDPSDGCGAGGRPAAGRRAGPGRTDRRGLRSGALRFTSNLSQRSSGCRRRVGDLRHAGRRRRRRGRGVCRATGRGDVSRTWPMAPSCSARRNFRSALSESWSRRGTMAAAGRTVSFACSPENLRLGKAIEVFTNPDRVVVGVRDERARARVQALLQPITDRIEWMSVESAEMTKHAVNAFLATSVTFINELAALCERTGADAKEVERGLKTERRIGPHAYLSPGGAFAGGTLARDVTFLRALGSQVWPAHAAHGRRAREQHGAPHVGATPARVGSGRIWPERRSPSGASPTSPAQTRFAGPTPWSCAGGSSSQGAAVHVHDPAAPRLPEDLAVTRHDDPLDAAAGARALVLATGWPAYREVDVDRLAAVAPHLLVLDANRFLGATLGQRSAVSVRRRGTAAGMSQPLAGRNAVITGANQGLGLAIAEAYVAAGASVLLCARDETLLEEARADAGGEGRAGPDRSRPSAPMSRTRRTSHEWPRSAVAMFPQVHVLVNNAGIYGPIGPSEDVDWAAWVRAMEINVYGSVLPCRALAAALQAAPLRQDRPTLGRRRDQSASAHQRLRRVEGRHRSVRRVARARSQALRHRRERHRTRGAEHADARRSARRRPGCGRPRFSRSHGQDQRTGRDAARAGAALAVYLGSAASDGITGRLLSAVWDPWEDLAEPSRRSRAQRCLHAAPDRSEGPRLHMGGPLNPPPGVAIVGCGLIGRKRAAALAGARLVACADPMPARARPWRRPRWRGRRGSLARRDRPSRRRYRGRRDDQRRADADCARRGRSRQARARRKAGGANRRGDSIR